jgi:rod shape-determining protein MreC
VVSIFTYRDERKLFALIATIIVVAIVALVQIETSRSGKASPITSSLASVSAYLEFGVSFIANGARNIAGGLASAPKYAGENAALRDKVGRLERANARMTEIIARYPDEAALDRLKIARPDGIEATVVGYDPEDAVRIVTIDRGTLANVRIDDGVVSPAGVVGRVIDAGPLSSRVLLVTEVTSRLPAVVQRGRWWAIAVGTHGRVKLQYVSQDAKLKVGDRVVTGEGRSFHAGELIGRISQIVPSAAGALDKTAIVEPAVAFGRLSNVVVLPK